MKKLAVLLPMAALAACTAEPKAQSSAAPTATATASAAPALRAPDQETFSTLFAQACPGAAKVNTAVCKRAGFGSEAVTCEYGLGDDTYLRNKATLAPAEGKWALQDVENVCKTDLNRPAG